MSKKWFFKTRAIASHPAGSRGRSSFAFRLIMPALCAWLGAIGPFNLAAGQPVQYELRSAVQVDALGVFLNALVQSDQEVPALRLCDSPPGDSTNNLTRAQIVELVRASGATLSLTNWSGAHSVRISRFTRPLAEAEALQLLTATLQEGTVKDSGELELRFSRPWATVNIPDEPVTLKVLSMPTMGVTPAFITRFELETAHGEHLGPWQAILQAHVWREVWVAHSTLKRGQSIQDADISRDRRDMLLCRGTLAEFDRNDSTLAMAESLSAGSPLLERSIMVRPVVHRGQTVVGLVQDGPLVITMKVEALEDGAPGQLIRLRNPVSRRDLRGKVLADQTILLAL